MDNDCQASGITADVGMQTRWFRKVNSCVQYESLTLQDLNIRSPPPPSFLLLPLHHQPRHSVSMKH